MKNDPSSPPTQEIPLDAKKQGSGAIYSPNPTHRASVWAKIVQVFGNKLAQAGLVQWREITLRDGSTVTALCFLHSKWLADPVTHELTLV